MAAWETGVKLRVHAPALVWWAGERHWVPQRRGLSCRFVPSKERSRRPVTFTLPNCVATARPPETRSFAAMATATAMKGLVGAAQANVRAEEESMDPVKLIASDGTEVILDRRAAMVSGTIKAMLAGPGASAAPSLLLAAV